jgi:hypothetical protein
MNILTGPRVLIGIGLLALAIFVFYKPVDRSTLQEAEARARLTATPSAVIVSSEPRYPGQVRVGQPVAWNLTIRNTGTAPVGDVVLWLSGEFAQGFVLTSTVPPFGRQDAAGDERYLHLGPLDGGATQEITINLVGKVAGEYNGTIGISADKDSLGSWKGRTVVLP